MKRHESFDELEEAIRIGEHRERQRNKRKAEVSKEDWQCGDCGTVYSYKVGSCTNPELDRWALAKFQEGYEYGKSVAEKELDKFKDALQTIEDFGFEVIFSRRQK
jgi:hypothetical protein